MAKEINPRQQQMRQRIAAAAARLMAVDGIEDFGLAKRKAARQLGAESTQSLPRNEEIEAELRAYQSLYQNDEQRARIRELRQLALEAMQALATFRPYLAGAVLKGTAGRYSEIELQLFTDDSKAVEMHLLKNNIPYEIAADRTEYAGDQPRAVAVLKLHWRSTPISLAIYHVKDERSTLRKTVAGRPIERASLQTVLGLLADRG